jgi:hypothetical protein
MTLIEITAATILALTTNAGINGKYVYNTECDNNNVVTSQTVYNTDYSGRYLTNKLKYNFTYDEQNRLTGKETLRWNAEEGQWVNESMMNYTYNAEGYSVELAYWNKNVKLYSDAREKCEYTLVDNNIMEVATYKWNITTNSFEQASRDAIYTPTANAMLATLK